MTIYNHHRVYNLPAPKARIVTEAIYEAQSKIIEEYDRKMEPYHSVARARRAEIHRKYRCINAFQWWDACKEDDMRPHPQPDLRDKMLNDMQYTESQEFIDKCLSGRS